MNVYYMKNVCMVFTQHLSVLWGYQQARKVCNPVRHLFFNLIHSHHLMFVEFIKKKNSTGILCTLSCQRILLIELPCTQLLLLMSWNWNYLKIAVWQKMLFQNGKTIHKPCWLPEVINMLCLLNICTLSSKPVMRILKLIRKTFSWSNMKFS